METYGLEKLGIINAKAVYRNLTPAQLTEHALCRGEGTLSNTGALVVKTGKYTGRSANDKFIVDTPAVHDDIAWGKVNRPIEKAKFDAIRAKVIAYLQGKEIFIFDGFAGADPKYTKAFRIVNELASQNLFIHQLLRRPTAEQLKDFKEDYTIIAAPGFKCIPEIDGTRSEAAILVDYEAHEVVICGTQYAGEIKKSVFSVMNYVLPKQGVFPMHCSANIGKNGDSAVFFGLSGTGKTTLSADPNRMLIGDDEHGWADDSVFNFEGGCYAKCINLSPEGEPEIYNAIKFGALVENVVMDPDTREFDFDDDSLAVNSRVGYPVEYIPNAELSGMSPSVPKTVIFLFNVIAALIFPTLGGMLGLTNEGFGLFAGTAVNDTSSVTAAASAWDSMHPGANVLESAAVVKLTRTLAIIPITLVLAFWQMHKAKKAGADAGSTFSLKKIFPFFVLFFVLASVITTVFALPAAVTAPLKTLSKFFIVMAMAAVGFNTNIVDLVKKGGKPIALGFCCWVGIACMSLGMQHVLGIW